MQKVREKTAAFWRRRITEDDTLRRFEGKEIGHKIADYVDDKTTALAQAFFDVAFEYDKKKEKPRPRSMGDFWLKSKGIYHPVNVKSGVVAASKEQGQPNMVSLKKLLDAILSRQIDSYYLLMIKFGRGEGWELQGVYFADMLDYLDCVVFDSGPGQIMLKPKKFYEKYGSRSAIKPVSLPEKATALMEMLEEMDKKLVVARKKKRGELREKLQEYRAGGAFSVSAKTQSGLALV